MSLLKFRSKEDWARLWKEAMQLTPDSDDPNEFKEIQARAYAGFRSVQEPKYVGIDKAEEIPIMIRFCQFLSGRNSLESFKKSLDFDFIKNCSNKIYPNLLSYLDYHNPRRYIFDAFDWNKSDRPASHWRVLSVEWENYLEKNNIL